MDDAAPRCPLCGGSPKGAAFPYATDWNGRRLHYLRCGACRSSFVDPMPSDADIRAMYSPSSYHAAFYAELTEEPTETRLPRFLSRLRSGRLLDFGCGNGAFLIAATAAGFTAEGVELDPATCEQAARNSRCPVATLDDIRRRVGQYDVIHLGDVLEHLQDPAGTLRELSGLLSLGGVFFIEGPLEDNASPVLWASRLFGAAKRFVGRSAGTFPPFHLFRATAKAQRAFFERRLGWHVRGFELWETGWPYRNPGDRLFRAGGVGRALRICIGAAAVGLAQLTGPLKLPIGNRFAALVEPSSWGVPHA